MLSETKKQVLSVGPFMFSVSSDIKAVHQYLEHHYRSNLVSSDSNQFIDYHVSVEHGSILRRLYKPQVIFKFNHRIPFKPLPLSQAHAMLEWGMNWVISKNAHQYLIIHAATLEKDGKGIIISAPSGSGKTTLCAYLVSQGWRLLSDELALISPEDELLYGLARPMNLKNHSIELMRPYFDHNDFSQVAKDTHKGEICLLRPPSESSINAHIGVKPSLLVFVKYSASEECYSEPVDKCLALTEIIQNSFNFGLLNKKGFQYARNLVDSTKAVYIEYNNFKSCENAIVDALNSEE